MHIFYCILNDTYRIVFIALSLLVGCQEEYQTCKNLSDEVQAWYLSGMRCK